MAELGIDPGGERLLETLDPFRDLAQALGVAMGIAAAFFVSILLIFACAYGDRTTDMKTMPGRMKSSVYLAWPVMSRGSSRRLIADPRMRDAMSQPFIRVAASRTAATMFW